MNWIQIQIIDFDSLPLAAASIWVNDTLGLVADMEGVVRFPKTEMKTIEIIYLGLSIPVYTVQDSSATDFPVKVYLPGKAEICFDNTKVMVKRNSITILGDSLNYDGALTLSRQR